jgi:hypothetical protein
MSVPLDAVSARRLGRAHVVAAKRRGSAGGCKVRPAVGSNVHTGLKDLRGDGRAFAVGSTEAAA